jgi:hypothetical protein
MLRSIFYKAMGVPNVPIMIATSRIIIMRANTPKPDGPKALARDTLRRNVIIKDMTKPNKPQPTSKANFLTRSKLLVLPLSSSIQVDFNSPS